eukprot:8286274-Alexandrium_andersonii.AAC.1
MSASLVGSEMCIRDRSSGARPGAAASSGKRLSPRVCPFRATCKCRAKTCLLYTSDAADDM